MSPSKKLARILSDLDTMAEYFESRGFETQSNVLDKAADEIEDVKYSLESL